MILDFIYSLFQNVVLFLVNLLPTTSINFGEEGLSSYLVNANQFVNMPLLMSFVAVFLVYEGVILTARLINWLWMTLKP